MPRRRLLLRRRPLRPCRKLLSRILLLRQRRFPVLHPLPRRQLLPAPCNASTHTLPRRRLLPLHRPQNTGGLHSRKLLFRVRTSITNTMPCKNISKRNGQVELHAVPHGFLLPLLRHDFPVDLRSRQLSGPRRPVRLQALHSRQLLLRNRPLRS